MTERKHFFFRRASLIIVASVAVRFNGHFEFLKNALQSYHGRWLQFDYFLLYFGWHFHFLSMNCIKFFQSFIVDLLVLNLKFSFFQIFCCTFFRLLQSFVSFFSDNLKSQDSGSSILGLRILSPRISDPRFPRIQDPQSQD